MVSFLMLALATLCHGSDAQTYAFLKNLRSWRLSVHLATPLRYTKTRSGREVDDVGPAVDLGLRVEVEGHRVVNGHVGACQLTALLEGGGAVDQGHLLGRRRRRRRR